jgi:hypothetical protein
MKIPLGVALILFAFLWLAGITMFYSDSFMTFGHMILYSGVCLLMIAFAAFLIYSHNRDRRA